MNDIIKAAIAKQDYLIKKFGDENGQRTSKEYLQQLIEEQELIQIVENIFDGSKQKVNQLA